MKSEHMTTIGSIADVYDGPHATPKKLEKGPYFLSISSLDKGRLNLNKSAFLSEDDYKKWTKRVTPEEGDLLFSYETRLGEVALMPAGIRACLGRRMGLLRLNREKVIPEYALYAYLSPAFQQTIKANTITGATVDRIALNELPNFPIRIPPLQEQKQVAKLLNEIDKKIDLNNRINAELEAMAKTLYDYWFVQFDFPDANGKPYKTAGGKMVYNPILKREIPEGWEVKKLVDIASLIRRGISPKYTEEGGISVLNQKCVRDQKISFEESRRHKIELYEQDERLLKLFDVVVNSTGVGTLGRVAYIKRLPEKKMTVDSHVSIIRADYKLVSPLYLAWKLMRHQPVIESAANGSTGQVELSKSFLEDIDVIIPPERIVSKFDEFVRPLVPKLAAIESENEQLVQLRDWLLPMLMNGQVTVTTSTQAATAEASHG